MTLLDQNDSPSNPNFLQKNDWGHYLDEDVGSEHIGYVNATWGIVQELTKILKTDDAHTLRSSIQELVTNRLDMLDHAHKAMDDRLRVSSIVP